MGYILGFNIIHKIFYYEHYNLFLDEDAYIIYDIYNVITPNDVFLFKRNKKNMIVPQMRNKSVGIEINFKTLTL